MIGRVLRRVVYELPLILLLGIVAVAGAFVVLVVLPDLGRSATGSPQPTQAATPSPPESVMSWMTLPDDADCAACHVTEQSQVGVRTVPALAHPLSGWTNCTDCHASDRLVATAPGHVGIHSSDCLICHKSGDLPAPLSRPHRELQNQSCLDCHGSTAPLPADMGHRAESVCWLCHRLPQAEPPLPAHRITEGQTDCLRCHVAGVVGALPDDHATRGAAECLLCHGPQSGTGQSRLPSRSEPPAVRYQLAVVTR